MKPSTREWVVKAEEHYLAALDLSRRRKRPLWSGVCFHAQQCAEKYLKARMEEAGLPLQRLRRLRPGFRYAVADCDLKLPTISSTRICVVRSFDVQGRNLRP